MKIDLNNIELQQFLKESTTTDISFLEEAKEKSDLIDSAKKRGILIENSKDLGIMKSNFLWVDKPNANGAILPKEKLLKVLPQIVGKPVNVGHIRNNIVGYVIDYAFVEKEGKAITYSIFFKDIFNEEWEECQELQKKNKLSVSFEIWSPQNKRKYNEDGSYSLDEMEMAGQAIIKEVNGERPAFKDAKVIEMAREVVMSEYLECASKYRCKDIIIEGEKISCGQCGQCELKKEETKKSEEVKVEVPKIKCLNCSEEFTFTNVPKVTDTTVKCPKCSAIVDNQGIMIYPPQIKDFQCSCPSCQFSNWLIQKRTEDGMELKCASCNKEFEVEFAKKVENDKRTFIYTGAANCYQCHNSIYFTSISKVKNKELECPKCGLSFNYELSSEYFKKIKKISPKVTMVKSKDEGGQGDMEIPIEVEARVKEMEAAKAQEQVEAPVVAPSVPEVAAVEEVKPETAEVKIEEPKPETKVEEPKVEESIPIEAKIEEVKVEPIVETPTIEELKIEEQKIEEKPKSEKETKKLERWQSSMKQTAKKCSKLSKENKELSKSKVDLESKLKVAEDKAVELQKDKEKETAEFNAKIEFHKANALKVYSRKQELGDYLTTHTLSDEDILDETKFEKAKLEKENELLKASVQNKNTTDRVGDVSRDDSYFSKIREEVKNKAKC